MATTPVSWAVEGDLDIFSLQDQSAWIKALLEPGRDLTVDLSQIGDLDPSGLQLLLSLRASFAARHQAFLVSGVSETLGQRLLALGVKDLTPMNPGGPK